MNRNPLVSVVMAAHNVERYVASAIESVLAQTFTDFELVVVNDGSTDQTLQQIQPYAQRDSRIRLIHQSRQGIPRVRNTACAHAAGKYIAVLDADDLALPDRLAKQVDYMETNPDVALLGGQVRYFNDQGLLDQYSQTPTDSEEVARRLPERNAFIHSTVMMRREVFRAVGDYRFPYAEEYDLYLRFADRYRLANLPDVLTYYRVHPNQRSVTGTIGDVLFALAARHCARARRRTGSDPIQGIPPNDVNVLLKVGVPSDEIVAALLTLPILNVDRYMAQNEWATARALLTQLDTVLRKVPSSRKARGQIAWLQSCTWKLRQAPLRKLYHLSRACCLDPNRFHDLLVATRNKWNKTLPAASHAR